MKLFLQFLQAQTIGPYSSQLNTVQIVTPSLHNISFSVILFLPQVLPNNLFPSRFTTRILYEFLLFLKHDIQSGARNVVQLIVHITYFYYYKSI